MTPTDLLVLLPQPMLDDLLHGFEAAFAGRCRVVLCDSQGNVVAGSSVEDHVRSAEAPIRISGQALGSIRVSTADIDLALEPAAAYLAKTFSHLANEIRRRQQLTDEVLARYDELNLIYGLGASFVRGASQDAIFERILEDADRIVRADAGVIYSWNTADGSLSTVSHFGVGDQTYWMGRIRELALNTLYAYEEAQLFDGAKIVCAPLRYNEQLLGALVFLYETEGKEFKASDLNLLTTLASNTALFIYAARLVDELARRNAELEAANAELKATQEKLSRAERLSIIGQTVGSLIHDMRNPLSYVMGYAGMLQEDDVSYDDRHMFAGQIVKYVKVFSDMAQEILDYIKGEDNVTKAPYTVKAIMDEVSDLLRPPGIEQTVQIEMKYSDVDSAVINVDRLRFVRVFQNLVNNSIDAIENATGSKVEIHAEPDGDGVRFSITDDGPGVPPQILDSIFEAGFTYGKPRGTGLGLAIALRMVKTHGGRIHYESAPGGGARFVFTIPQYRNGSHT